MRLFFFRFCHMIFKVGLSRLLTNIAKAKASNKYNIGYGWTIRRVKVSLKSGKLVLEAK